MAIVAIGLPLAGLLSDQFLNEWLSTSHPLPAAVAVDAGAAKEGTQWQVPGAWGFHAYDIVNSFLLVVTLLFVIRSIWVAEAALNKSHHAYVRSLADSRYDAMDRLYFDLLRERRERRYPYKDPPAGEQHPHIAYDPYPLMVWNFIETVVDKCEKDPSGELMATWAPLISAEACNFGDFMKQRDANGNLAHSAYFKNEFMLLALALIPASEKQLAQEKDLDVAAFLRLFRALEKIKNTAERDAATLAATDRRSLELKWRINGRKFACFKSDAEFLDCFARIHSDERLRKAATEKWELPDEIRHDGLQNNEQAREDFIYKKYYELTERILDHLTSAPDGGAARTAGVPLAAASA